MIAKEWRVARWILLLGMLAFLVLIPTMRSYQAIQNDVAFQIRMAQQDLRSPEESMGGPIGEQDRRDFLASQREYLREMQSPGYVEDLARWELQDLSTVRNLFILVPLACLFGVGLISTEVARGSLFLLLSKPVSRTRMLVTKYSVCVACLFVVAVVGGASTILTAYARGYPPESVQAARILGQALLAWLGSLFALGVAAVASVIFRDVLRTLVATAATMFVILAAPDLLRALVEWIAWGDRVYMMDSIRVPWWYETFDHFRLYGYWFGVHPYVEETIVARSLLVCVATAAVALLLALWLFRRKAY